MPRLAVVLLLLTAGGLAACSSSSGAAANKHPPVAPTESVALSDRYPNAIVVLGHSGTTGYESDPAAPGTDARQNSWATGENPDVDSIYSRLLAVNPAVEGHASNFGVDGSTVDDLAPQVDQALALDPLPDLFMVQEVDNDMQCDGTDKDNYEPFAQTLTEQLTRITTAAPKATILLVSSPPGTVQNYGRVVSQHPGGVAANTGSGPCDMFDSSGAAVPPHWRYQEKVITGYHAQLAAVCKQFPTCVYDDGALYRMRITADDLADDYMHLSVSGHNKQAALEWGVLGYQP